MQRLPHWVLPDKFPALYDTESATAIEMTAKLYGAMNGLIDEYNKFVDGVNAEIEKFESDTNKDNDTFKIAMAQQFQDFIDVVELKLQSQDKEIEDAFNYMKNNIAKTTADIIHSLLEKDVINVNIAVGNRKFNGETSFNGHIANVNTEKALINHEVETSATNTSVDTLTVIKNKVTYTDNDPTANENIKFPTNFYSELELNGYTMNETEAIAQGFPAVMSTFKNKTAGMIGGCAFSGRTYLPNSDEIPSIKEKGGSKAGVYDAQMFTDTEYEYGGYALGMEIDIFDTCTKGQSPVYENNDFGAWDRTTCGLIVGCGGHTQPISQGIRIQGMPSYQNGCWNGITIGQSAMKINGVGGVKGLVGLNMGSWRYDGGYGEIAIKHGYASRHVYCKEGYKISTNVSAIYPLETGVDNLQFNLCNVEGKATSILFNSVDDLTKENPQRTELGGLIHGSNGMMTLFSNNRAIRLSIRVDNEEVGGLALTTGQIVPLTNGTTNLGSTDNPFNCVCCNSIKIGNTTLNEAQLKALLGI